MTATRDRRPRLLLGAGRGRGGVRGRRHLRRGARAARHDGLASGIPIDELQRAAPIVSGFLLGYVAMLPLIGRIADLRGRVPVLVGVAGGVRRSARWSPRSAYDLPSAGGRPVPPGRRRRRAGARDPGPGRRPLPAPSAAAYRSASCRRVQELGSVLGPLYGAVVLAVADWRAIFAVNLVVGLVLAVAHPPGRAPRARRADRATPSTRPPSTGSGWPSCAVDPGGRRPGLRRAGSLAGQRRHLGPAVHPGGRVDAAGLTPLGLVAIVAAVLLLVVRCWTARRPLVDLRGWWATSGEADLPGALLLAVGPRRRDPGLRHRRPPGRGVRAARAGGTSSAPRSRPVVLVWHLRTDGARRWCPRGALRRTPAWGALLVSFFVGAALIAALIDIPIFARTTVYPDSQLLAALVLVRFLVALPVGAVVGGYLIRAAAGRAWSPPAAWLLAALGVRADEPAGA